MIYTNIAFYHFFKVPEYLETHRRKIKRLCAKLALRGTVLIAQEGLNLMVAGRHHEIEEFKSFLRKFIGKENLFFKESSSSYIPFNRMLVKAKQQLIPVNDSSVDPEKSTAEHLPPETLKQWFDEGKDMLLLDTRNDFEVTVGTFEGAHNPHIAHFRDFEDKLQTLPEEWKKKTVVAFCTGGIRCEKATPLMRKHGFKNVYQLDGGILNYFEKVGGSHYQGDCFVFDRRVALNAHLKESTLVECFICRHPVTAEEQTLPTYQYEKHCPHCFKENSASGT